MHCTSTLAPKYINYSLASPSDIKTTYVILISYAAYRIILNILEADCIA